MIITIAKQFTFDAAHHLPCMPEGHKCRNLHGHTYGVELQLTGNPSIAKVPGILIDFDDIRNIWMPLHVALDHKLLNEVPGLDKEMYPTTENLVRWIIERMMDSFRAHQPAITRLGVRVSESSTTYAECTIELAAV